MRRIWVNGVFDILHVGHVRLLRQARLMGDHLTVGINSDVSVRRYDKLRSNGRPFIAQDERAEMLRSIRWVDDVIVFDETDPLAAIEKYGPFTAIVKGVEYREKNMPERWLDIPIHYVDGGATHSSDIVDIIRRTDPS